MTNHMAPSARRPPGHADDANARFDDLCCGGRALAAALRDYALRDTIVLGIVRGGVPASIEVARGLGLPLDLLVLRRVLLDPGGEPLCIFNVAGVRVTDAGVRAHPAGAPTPLGFFLADAFAEFARREAMCRPPLPAADLSGKTVLLVDNGMRTGGTMRAAIRAVRERHPARVVAAVPFACEESRQGVEAAADVVVCPGWRRVLPNVAAGYRNFHVPEFAAVGHLVGTAWRQLPRT